jgi:curved DNA-binding protein CbpA
MGLLDEVEQQFAVKCLYELFEVDSNATATTLKRAYRRLSLKHHPDKFAGDPTVIERQTQRFAILAKVHRVLSDDEMRAVYDEQGLVLDEDGSLSGSDGDWTDYWRRLFPKITRADIDEYMRKYLDSQEELDDVKTQYERHSGDMNLISECLIGFEESRTRSMIDRLIKDGELSSLPGYVNESTKSREKRRKRLEKERKEVEQSDGDDEQLMLAIRNNREKREQGFDAWIAGMEARYAGSDKDKKSKKSGAKRIKK